MKHLSKLVILVLALACILGQLSGAKTIRYLADDIGYLEDGTSEGSPACDSVVTLQGFGIELLGVTDNGDDTFTWTYRVTSDGDDHTKALSHWTLALCDIDVVIPCEPECEGGIVDITLLYTGLSGVDIEVDNKDDNFANFHNVQNGDTLFIDGSTLPKEKFEPELKLTVIDDGTVKEVTKIHVSCSQPIGIGYVYGSFTVVNFTPKGGSEGPTYTYTTIPNFDGYTGRSGITYEVTVGTDSKTGITGIKYDKASDPLGEHGVVETDIPAIPVFESEPTVTS